MKIKEEIKHLLIFGYIRNEIPSKQLNNFIFKLILKLYPLNDIKWSGNSDECSICLKHLNSDVTLKWGFGLIGDSKQNAFTGFVNTVITNEMCKKFDIEFIINGWSGVYILDLFHQNLLFHQYLLCMMAVLTKLNH